MDKIEEYMKKITQAGFNINDFTITDDGYHPRRDLNIREVTKEENTPIIEDVNDVAEFATIIATDKDEIAEMLVYALQRIDELEGRLDG